MIAVLKRLSGRRRTSGAEVRYASVALVLLAFAAVSAQNRPAVPELVPQGRGMPISYRVAFGADGHWLAQSDHTRLRIFDTATGKMARELTVTNAAGDAWRLLAFAAHPHAHMVVMCDTAGAVIALDVATGAELWRTRGMNLPKSKWPMPPSANLRFTADGRLVDVSVTVMSVGRRDVSGTTFRLQVSVDGNVIGESKEESAFDGIFGSIPAAPSFSEDGRWMHVRRRVDAGDRVRVRDVNTRRDVGPELDGVVTASHGAANRVLLTTVGSTVLKLVEADSGQTIANWVAGTAMFSADGSRILISTDFSALTAIAKQYNSFWSLVDAATGQIIATSPPHTPVTAAWALSPDGQRIATIQQDKLVVAELRGPIQYTTVTGSSAPPLAAPDPTAAPLPASPGAERMAELTGMFRSGQVTPAAAFSRDRRWLVARAEDRQIDVWDAATGNRMPFRLPAPAAASGPLVVREPRPPAGAVTDRWQPLEVDAPGSAQEQIHNKSYRGPAGAACLQGEDCPAREWSCSPLRTLGYEALLRAGVDPKWTGCSVSPDGLRVVLAGTENPGKPLTRSFSCRWFLRCGARLVVFDIARRTSVPLRDEASVSPANFSVAATSLEWSPDGAFVISQEPGLADARLRVWATATGAQIDVEGSGLRGRRSAGFLPGPARLLTSSVSLATVIDLDVWDLHTQRRLVRLDGVPQFQFAATLSGASAADLAVTEHAILGPDTDGEVWIRSLKTGSVIGQLRVLQNGEWLVTTPSGLFDGSPGGWRQLAWRVGDGVKVAPGELYFNEFYQPGLLADLLAGRTGRVVRAVADRDRRQPALTVAAEAVDARSAVLRITASEAPAEPPYPTGTGVQDVRLFRNGVLVRAWRGAVPLVNGTAQLEARVPLIAGVNRFVAYAFNADNIKSADAVTELKQDGPARDPTVYVIAVGINRYTNREFDLAYAVPDATTFAADFTRAQQALGLIRVRVVTLLDGDATRQNILLALARLGGGHDGQLPVGAPAALLELERAQPEDTVVVYFAGHGVARDDRFHLIPSDLEYRGTRAEAHAAVDQLLARSISDRDLERAFEPIDARHLLLVIDACDSGQALASDDTRFGPMNSRGLAQLAYEKGMFILTASQAYQAALESAQLGHGYLTYALVKEGLKPAVADQKPADGEVTALEWFEYAVARVPQLQLEAVTRAQQGGRLLTFAPTATGGDLQTPRVFSRRDDVTALIIARP